MMIEWPRRGGRNTLREHLLSAPSNGWSAHQLRLPVSWYTEMAAGAGVEFPVSGDATAATSRLLGFIRDGLGMELYPWQERALLNLQHARDTPRPTHP
ncbi:hypothetical protein [Arthrobacter sp. HS15c]|uniref:hypothetical protein n=1 Tax=Arthrobacter sp. HS15c TaxID=3230279 RepID=UPI003467C78D